MGAAKAAPPPLMTLRDLLELACESSCSEGFRSYPRRLPWHGHDQEPQLRAKAAEEDTAPVRLLIEADLRRSPSRTLSSILFPRSPGSLAAVSRLTRSLSRRLVFWRRHREDAGERDSLGLPSPVVSSCSASECSEPAAEAPDLPVPEEQAPGPSDQSEKPSTSTSSSGIAGSADDAADAAGDGHHKALDGEPAGSSSVESMEDKQQLSPVSVMDFPFHDDDGDERSDAGTCSPSFQQRQPDLERPSSAHEPPPHRIRRLDGLAQAAVDPVDLEPRFVASDESGPSVSDDTQRALQSDSSSTSTNTDHDSASATTSTTLSDEEHRSAEDGEHELEAHHRLFTQLIKDDGGGTAAASAVAAERLLLDFFAEGLDRGRSSEAGPVVGTVNPSVNSHDESALVRAAKDWMQGAGTQWGVEDVLYAGPAAVADMDRERRWMRVGEEEREVGAAVEGLLVDALVAELVRDLQATWC